MKKKHNLTKTLTRCMQKKKLKKQGRWGSYGQWARAGADWPYNEVGKIGGLPAL
jgi:hypothetical protein